MGIIARQKEHAALTAGLPRPLNKALMKTARKALGEAIDINLTSCKAIKERLRKERQSWRILRRGLLTNMALSNKTKLLLWSAIARSTLTYGIQTLALKEQDKQRLDGFTFYCIRQIQHIYRTNKPQKPQCANLHITMRQPTNTHHGSEN